MRCDRACRSRGAHPPWRVWVPDRRGACSSCLTARGARPARRLARLRWRHAFAALGTWSREVALISGTAGSAGSGSLRARVQARSHRVPAAAACAVARARLASLCNALEAMPLSEPKLISPPPPYANRRCSRRLHWPWRPPSGARPRLGAAWRGPRRPTQRWRSSSRAWMPWPRHVQPRCRCVDYSRLGMGRRFRPRRNQSPHPRPAR